MRLAEALILRADCQKRFEQLKARIVGNAKVQEGDEPAEYPQTLIDEAERVATELLSLISRINKTNSATPFMDGKTLTDALAKRDNITLRRAIYADLAKAASVVQTRTSKSEVKFKRTISVSDVQSQIDSLSKAYRELDSSIQELNWKIDLLD